MSIYGIGEDPICFWIADINKFYGMPECVRKVADYRLCSLGRGKCPVVNGGECKFPRARRMGNKFDPSTMKKE